MALRAEQSRRIRIAVAGASPCPRCSAACCKRTVSEFAVLLETDEERRRFAAWSVTIGLRDAASRLRHERVIPYREGGKEGACCTFLGRDDRCTIYEDRPQACRRFECTRHFNQEGLGRHGLFLRGNAQVVQLLQAV